MLRKNLKINLKLVYLIQVHLHLIYLEAMLLWILKIIHTELTAPQSIIRIESKKKCNIDTTIAWYINTENRMKRYLIHQNYLC